MCSATREENKSPGWEGFGPRHASNVWDTNSGYENAFEHLAFVYSTFEYILLLVLERTLNDIAVSE